MRTYERGVEGETLACGTGAVAVGCTAGSLEPRDASCDPVDAKWPPARGQGQRGITDAFEDVWLVGRRGWCSGVMI